MGSFWPIIVFQRNIPKEVFHSTGRCTALLLASFFVFFNSYIGNMIGSLKKFILNLLTSAYLVF